MPAEKEELLALWQSACRRAADAESKVVDTAPNTPDIELAVLYMEAKLLRAQADQYFQMVYDRLKADRGSGGEDPRP